MNPFLPIVLFIFIFCNSILSAENKPILNVYAPDYFASEWGPGPVIKSSFDENQIIKPTPIIGVKE